MAVIAGPLTVEEFRKLPEDSGPYYHELRHGEPVAVTRPKLRHTLIQRNLRKIFEPLVDPTAFVEIEVAFRPLPEHELRVADVAYVCRERWELMDPDDNILGAPDLVIEVLSPNNTAAEIYEKEKLCLENGAKEFWVVDPERGQVKMSTPDGHTITYASGQEIPLPLLGNATIAVTSIFAQLPR